MATRKLNKDLMWAAVVRWYPAARVPSSIDAVTDEQCANALRKRFKAYGGEHGQVSLSRCTECGELSPVDEAECPACPFCGEGGVVDAEDEPAETPAKTEASAMGIDKSNGKAKKEPKAAAAAPAKAKKDPKTKAKREPKAAAAAKAEIIPQLTDAQKAKLREQLDASVKTIRDLQRDMLKNGYDLGKELTRVFDAQSWKARGKWRNFKEWCAIEAGFTTMMARQYMSAVKEFDRETYAKLGVQKLAIIARLPEGERKPVLKMAEDGADVKTLQAKVVKVREHLRAASGETKRGPGRPPSDTISTPVKMSKREVELVLFARDPDKHGKPIPLDSFEPDCWTYLDLGGGVYQRIRFATNKSGQITRVLVSTSRKAVDPIVAAPAN